MDIGKRREVYDTIFNAEAHHALVSRGGKFKPQVHIL